MLCQRYLHINYMQREFGEGRSYAVMWRKYKRRVLLAMSSLAFAQLVSHFLFYGLRSTYERVFSRMESMVRCLFLGGFHETY